jgi:hypothetical protein
MNPTDEEMSAAVVDGLGLPPCSQCEGVYRLTGDVLADYVEGDWMDGDDDNRAWKCNLCGSITFDDMLVIRERRRTR